MKITKIFTTIILLSTLFPAFSQINKTSGTYLYSDKDEYMQIDKDNFKIIRTEICTPCVNLDEGDSIASYGRVEYIQGGLIKLTSAGIQKLWLDYKQDGSSRVISDEENDIFKTMSVKESHDSSLKDSIKIKFVFPFKGKYRIDASLIGNPRLSTENDSIIIPRDKYTLEPLNFEIYNLSLQYNGRYGECFGRIAFCNCPEYEFNSRYTNSLLITIPKLTNSYFARYVIDGEYVKVEKDRIIWRNRVYNKISDNLVNPQIEYGDVIKDIDNVDLEDIADKEHHHKSQEKQKTILIQSKK